jgi:hypothetical protein
MKNLATAGKLWDDEDFATMKMDEYCKDIWESLKADNITPTLVRHVGLWHECWETHVNGPNDNAKLKKRLKNKYVILKLYDRDYGNRLLTCMKAYFKKKRGDNKYCIFVVMEGYDPNKDDMDESNYPLLTLWDSMDEALYDCIQEYYIANPGEDGVVLHKKNSGVDSDHDE